MKLCVASLFADAEPEGEIGEVCFHVLAVYDPMLDFSQPCAIKPACENIRDLV